LIEPDGVVGVVGNGESGDAADAFEALDVLVAFCGVAGVDMNYVKLGKLISNANGRKISRHVHEPRGINRGYVPGTR